MLFMMPQPQQRGAQLPREAIKDRDAQDHDRADQDVGGAKALKQPVYPAGRMQDEPKHDPQDDLPLPEGK